MTELSKPLESKLPSVFATSIITLAGNRTSQRKKIPSGEKVSQLKKNADGDFDFQLGYIRVIRSIRVYHTTKIFVSSKNTDLTDLTDNGGHEDFCVI